MLYRHAFLFMGFVSADQVDPDDQYDYVYEETKYEGVCVLSHNHKDTPSPEPLLNGECRQWRNNSCCMPGWIHSCSTTDFKRTILETNTHLFGSETRKTKFQHNHCGEMTEQCLVLMYRQWCLYQCDPYLEPWIINRKEVSIILSYFLPEIPNLNVSPIQLHYLQQHYLQQRYNLC